MNLKRRGFSLVELIVVIIIMGIISSLIVMTYRSNIATVDDAEASAVMDRVVLSERSFANAFGVYTAWPADLASVGKDINIVPATSTATLNDPVRGSSTYQVSLVVGDKGTLGIAMKSSGNVCVLRQVTSLESGSIEKKSTTTTNCSAIAALPGGEAALPAQTARY